MAEDNRGDPGALLKAVKASESKAARGRLKIYLGMAAGVGKTYEMLEDAHEAVREGVDLLVGIVETHGRPETAKLLEGLKRIPEKVIHYKGKSFKELDVDAVLKIHPRLVLIDELAHTNIPGSRHPKRWQDVMEVLEAGIDVYTTLNIQHLESYKNIVEGIVNCRMGETVPDLVFEEATDIELVDITPLELLQRLREGKVYTDDLGEIAAENFFQEDRLTALREIALRCGAEKVDQELHEMVSVLQKEKGWKPRERLLVVIDQNPGSQQLIRTARRFAFSLHAPWIALYVDDGKSLDAQETANLAKNLELAQGLGAEVITTKDLEITRGIERVADQKGVTQIIVEREPRGTFKNLFRSSLSSRLAKERSDIDLHIVRLPSSGPYKKKKLKKQLLKERFLRALNVFFFLCAFFIIPVLVLNYLGGVAFLIIFLIFVILGGAYIVYLRERQELLLEREKSVHAIYEIVRDIAMEPSMPRMFKAVQDRVGSILQGTCEILPKKPDDALAIGDGTSIVKAAKEKAVADWAFQHGQLAGWSTSTLPSVKNLYIPLKGYKEVVGVLAYRPLVERSFLPEQTHFLHTVAQLLANYLERSLSEERVRKEQFHIHIEHVYGKILRSISDELVRPLQLIRDAISACKQDEEMTGNPRFFSSLHKVEKSSEGLMRIAENTATMARLSMGLITFEKSPHDVNELIASCLKKLEKALKKHHLVVAVAKDIGKVAFDFPLMEILLSNLLTNAAEYSPPDTVIEIEAASINAVFILSVADEGKGIPEDLMELVFEKFYRVPGTTSTGIGLGLPIAKSIAEIHGGSIQAENRPSGGAKFTVSFPL